MLTASPLCCKGLVGQKVVVVAGFSKAKVFTFANLERQSLS